MNEELLKSVVDDLINKFMSMTLPNMLCVGSPLQLNLPVKPFLPQLTFPPSHQFCFRISLILTLKTCMQLFLFSHLFFFITFKLYRYAALYSINSD